MNHADMRTHMAGYLEGDLPIAERALFDAHLDGCEICALEIAEMRATISLLRSLPEPEVPADLTNQVLRRIRAGEGRQTWLDHARAAVEFLTAPRILAPVSATMLAAGVLMATGQLPRFMPSDPSHAGTEVSIVLQNPTPQPTSSSLSSAPQRLLVGTESASAERRIGASAADEFSAEQFAGGSSIVQRRSSVVAGRSPGHAVDSHPERMGPSGGVALEIAPFVAFLEPTPVPLARSPQAMQVSSQPRAGSPEPVVQRRPQSEMLGAMRRPRRAHGDSASSESMPSSGEWIAHALRNPAHFAETLANRTLAESELWVDNLARHAVAQGELDAVIQAFRGSSSAQARLLAEEFEAAGRRARAEERGDSSGGR